MKKPKFLTRNIMLLAMISFFTDVASEMLFPVMPLYLKEIGYGILTIGILEGAAELIAGIMKLYAGRLSDNTGNRSVFVRVGYSISAFAKPSIGFMTSFWSIFSMRFLDRIGKGIRTAPRDALLADESSPENRGKVFGFHRSMDTLGATLGPIISLGFLLIYSDYTKLFLFAFIPGIIAILLTFIIKDKKNNANISIQEQSKHEDKKSALSFKVLKEFWQNSSQQYKRVVFGFIVFALINSSNVFLLLRAKELGLSDVYMMYIYLVHIFFIT
jgi:MFS family permease